MSQWARNNPELCREQFVREWLNKTPSRQDGWTPQVQEQEQPELIDDASGIEEIERHELFNPQERIE